MYKERTRVLTLVVVLSYAPAPLWSFTSRQPFFSVPMRFSLKRPRFKILTSCCQPLLLLTKKPWSSCSITLIPFIGGPCAFYELVICDWLLRRQFAYGHDEVSPIGQSEHTRITSWTGLSIESLQKRSLTRVMDGVCWLSRETKITEDKK